VRRLADEHFSSIPRIDVLRAPSITSSPNSNSFATIPGGLLELFIGVWLIAKGFNSTLVPSEARDRVHHHLTIACQHNYLTQVNNVGGTGTAGM
jgi:hypothetical protein